MNTHVANTQVAKTGGISNKDSKVRKSISNKESCEDESSRDIPKVIKLFESVDPKNRRYYSNKTQREACAFLLEEYGLEQVGAALDFYNRVRRIDARYLPTITTPLQLVEKWQQLALYIQRARDKKKEELSNFIA